MEMRRRRYRSWIPRVRRGAPRGGEPPASVRRGRPAPDRATDRPGHGGILVALASTIWIAAACADLQGLQGPVIPVEFAWRELGILQYELTGSGSASAMWAGIVDSSHTWQGALESESILTPPVVIKAPGRVTAGKPFQVTVYTIGSNGCWSADGEDVRVSPGEVEILPYDRHSGAELCTRMIQYIPHRVELNLDSPGSWTVRVRGRLASEANVVRQTQVTARRTIVVEP